jgi:hypothetical protein
MLFKMALKNAVAMAVQKGLSLAWDAFKNRNKPQKNSHEK